MVESDVAVAQHPHCAAEARPAKDRSGAGDLQVIVRGQRNIAVHRADVSGDEQVMPRCICGHDANAAGPRGAGGGQCRIDSAPVGQELPPSPHVGLECAAAWLSLPTLVASIGIVVVPLDPAPVTVKV